MLWVFGKCSVKNKQICPLDLTGISDGQSTSEHLSLGAHYLSMFNFVRLFVSEMHVHIIKYIIIILCDKIIVNTILEVKTHFK